MLTKKKITENNLINFSLKLKLFFLIIIYFSFIFLFSFILNIDYYQVWKFFGVPAREILFSDIYPFFVNNSCKVNLVNLEDYYDQFKNCDGWKRTFNYMPIWTFFLKLGVHQKYHLLSGFVLVSLFFFSFFKIIKINSFNDLYIYILIILSPAVMLAVERGNTDLLIFFLCFIFLILLQKNNLLEGLFSYILILFSSFLKFYPIFLVFIFFRRNIWNKILSIFIFFIFIFYTVINFTDILLVKENTQETFFFSYGYNVLEVGLNNIKHKLEIIFLASKNYLLNDYATFKDGISDILYTNEFKNKSFAISRLLLLVVIFLIFIKNIRNYDLKNKTFYDQDYLFFILGASIFCGTFILGANFDYRLIFLLFTFPYLIKLKKKNKKFLFVKQSFFVYLIIFYLWLTPLSLFTSGLDEIITWLIFAFYLDFLCIYYLNVFFKKNS